MKNDDWMNGLGIRLANIFYNLRIESREQAFHEYQKWNLQGRSRWPRHYGWESHKGLARWLGLPEPTKPEQKQIKNNILGFRVYDGKRVIYTGAVTAFSSGDSPHTITFTCVESEKVKTKTP